MNCPLCDAPLIDHDTYVVHLADADGLVDDPGTASVPVTPVEEPAPQPQYAPPPPPPSPLPPTPTVSRRTTAIAVAVAALVIIVAGALLLRSPDSSEPEATTGSTIPTTTLSPDAPPPVDAARVAGVNVQTSDFPADWVTSPQRGTPASADAAVATLMSCLGIDRPAVDHDVKSFDFKRPDAGMHVQSDVMYGATSGLERYEAALAGPKGRECVQALVADQENDPSLPDTGVTVAGIEVSDARPVPGGDQGIAFTVKVTFDTGTRKVSVFTDFYSVRVGPLVFETFFNRLAASRATATTDPVLAAQLDRAHALVG